MKNPTEVQQAEYLYSNLHGAAGNAEEDAELEAAKGDLEALRRLAKKWGLD